jgi:RNA polymerase sigma factor (sigma-70 family)
MPKELLEIDVDALEGEETSEDIEPHHYALDSEEGEKRKVYGKTHSHILDLLTKEIGHYEVIDKTEFINLIRDVEDLYSQAIDMLAKHSEYLEGVVAKIVAEVLAGITKGKVIHNIPGKKDDPVWNRNSEFLTSAISLLASAPSSSREDFADGVKKLRIVGSLLYNALEEFCSLGLEYEECSTRLAELMLERSAIEEIEEAKDVLKALASDLRTHDDDVIVLTHGISPIFQRIQEIHRFIFDHHSRLLIKVAKSLTNDSDQLLDNFQAGGFGLIRAIRDYTPPYNFVGHASNWIRQSILSNMRMVSNSIRIPGNIIQEYSSLERTRQKLPGNKQDIEEMSSTSGRTREKIKRVYDLISIARTYSLDREVNSEDSDTPSTIQDLIPDESTTPEKFTEGTEVDKLMSLLDPQEQWVVANYFGLQDYLGKKTRRSHKECADLERVRQLYIATSSTL